MELGILPQTNGQTAQVVQQAQPQQQVFSYLIDLKLIKKIQANIFTPKWRKRSATARSTPRSKSTTPGPAATVPNYTGLIFNLILIRNTRILMKLCGILETNPTYILRLSTFINHFPFLSYG